MEFGDEYITAARCLWMWKNEDYSKTRATGGQSWADGVTEGRLASLVYLLLNNMQSSNAVHCSLVFLFYRQ